MDGLFFYYYYYYFFRSSWLCWPGNFCTDVQFTYRHEFTCTVGQNRVFPPVSPLPSLQCCFPPQLTMERAESWTTNDRVSFRFSPAEASTNEQVKWMACNYRAGSEGRTGGLALVGANLKLFVWKICKMCKSCYVLTFSFVCGSAVLHVRTGWRESDYFVWISYSKESHFF